MIAIARDWALWLIEKKKFGPSDPVFPKTTVGPGASGSFTVYGLGRAHWANATPVRHVFRAAFKRVDLPYYNPHSIRNTLTQLAYALQLSPEQFKAWSQNMGHDKPLTALNSYGQVSAERQVEIISSLAHRQLAAEPSDTMAEKIAELVAAKLFGGRRD